MIAIIDYDAGNIKSVEKAIQILGEEVIITRDRKHLKNAQGVILPGVGSFGDAMHKLQSYGLTDVIREIVSEDIPFLGICLGLHLLFESSEESPGVNGLGILPGEIVRFPEMAELKVPHIGWNSLTYPSQGRLFEGISEHAYVYFVHSYYLKAKEETMVTAEADYGIRFHASIEKRNIFACQFHPEKSSQVGLTILRNFINVTKTYSKK